MADNDPNLPINDPELPGGEVPIVNIDNDDQNPMLLSPDHPLLAAFQKQQQQQNMGIWQKTLDTLRELRKLKDQMSLRQEDAGVELHKHQQNLADAQQKIERLDQQFNEAKAGRQAVQEVQKQVSENLRDNEAQLYQAQKEEEEIRTLNWKISQDNLAVASSNEELKSDAIVRKRAVYRAEEQIKEQETLKMDQERLISMNNENLKQLQDQETYLTNQLDIQKQETDQAESILKEAERQMNDIKKDINDLRIQWQLTLNQVEKKTTLLRAELEVQIEELESEKKSIEQGLISGRREVSNLLGQISKLSDMSRAKQAQKQSLEAEMRRVIEVEIGGLQQNYNALESALAEANSELNRQNANIIKIQKETDALSNQNDAAQRELNERENNILITNAEQSANNRQLMGLLAEAKHLRDQIKECKRDIAKTVNEVQKRNLDAVTTEQSVNTLQNANDALTQETEQKGSLITSYETQIKKNANAIEQRSSAITRLNKKLEEFSKAHPESDNGPLQATLNNIGKELISASKQVKDVQSAWLRAQTDLVEYSQQYQEETDEIDLKEQQKALLERKLRDLDFENQSNKLKITAIKRDIEFLHKDLVLMNDKIAQCNKQIVKMNEVNFDAEINAQELVDGSIDTIEDSQKQLMDYKQEKADIAASLVEIEEQAMLWQRKINIQYMLMKNIKDNCSLAEGGEIAQMEQKIHIYEVEISQLKKKQRQMLDQLTQMVSMREVYGNRIAGTTALAQTRNQGTLRPQMATGAQINRQVEMVSGKITNKKQEHQEARGRLDETTRRHQSARFEQEELQGVLEQMRRKQQELEDPQ